MVPLNMTYLHCLQHSLFEHLFNLYYLRKYLISIKHGTNKGMSSGHAAFRGKYIACSTECTYIVLRPNYINVL